MLPKIDPTSTRSWESLYELAKADSGDIKSLFTDPNRFDKFSFKNGEFLFDFSKNNISEAVLSNLLVLADECHLSDAISAQFSGSPINETENRAVLHTALRDLNAQNANAKKVEQELNKIKSFSERLLSGNWKGYSGKGITNVVNIGIGGSDLGPKMVACALRDHWSSITPHFISNVDAAQLAEELEGLNPETTLFIIASKTFTTQETMTNAATAKSWF